MSDSNNRVKELFQKYLSDEATDAERQEFLDYVNDPLYKLQIQELLSGAFENQSELTDLSAAGRTRVLNHIFIGEVPRIGQTKPRQLWPRIAAAAVIIMMIGAGLFYFTKKQNSRQLASHVVKPDILPGGNKAFLTLANGRRISLTDAAEGSIAKQAGVSITKTGNGQVIYSISNTIHNSGKTEYNFIETPKGGQYQVTLPDGTTVWLNAASSLKYPTSFASLKDREVELTGEGYFEVAKDKAHPFIVKSNNQNVEVLGTHFNINSYADEPATKTTLLEGSIRLNSNRILKPGEQAVLIPSGTISVMAVNTGKAVAWKNGKFVFENEGIESIMRKLSRWYNVEVVYEGNFSDRTFTGSISRYDNISKILDKITFIQAVHFKIEGRRVTVMR